MKNLYALLTFLICILFSASGQNIVSFTISPVSPTSNDTITIITESEFSSGACYGEAHLTIVNGDKIYADAQHCVGMLAVICNDFDTVIIPPLSPGQYSYIFSLSVGQGFPCSPGIVPSDIDSVIFNVTDATGIIPVYKNSSYSIMPNPTTGNFLIKSGIDGNCILKIFSADGKLIKSIALTDSNSNIEWNSPAGIYILLFESRTTRSFSRLTVIN